MDYHIERGLRLNQTPEYRNLYRWAIYEIDEKGQQIGTDQIPWPWSFVFKAKTCAFVASTETERSYKAGQLSAFQIKDHRVIRAELRPSVFGDEDDWRRNRPRFSMFGTDRVIEEFTLDIRPVNSDAKEQDEGCSVWGGVSYTAEVDYRDRTEPDVIVFTMMVRPETFARYAALIAQNAISEVSFRVKSVQGFYSDWSPSISTNKVKVLAAGGEQAIEPHVDGIDPPRLGDIGEAEVSFVRRVVFEKPPASDSNNETDDAPLVEAQPQGLSVADPRLLEAILALKRVVWLGVAVLAIHLLITLGQ